MARELKIVEGPYLRDILAQPDALRDTHSRLESSPSLAAIERHLVEGWYQRVVLTGMGSSFHGLHPLHLRLVETGVSAVMVETSELLHYQRRLLEERTLLVLVSQSGRSAEIVRLLEATRGRLETLGVTNTPDSPLAQDATAVVMTHAGDEATVACKSYLTSQLALAWLGTVLVGGSLETAQSDLAASIALIESYLDRWREHVEEVAEIMDGVRAVFYVGRGPSLAAACSAGLITKEATHLPAEGMGSAAFRHGPLEMLDDRVFLLAYAGEPRTRALNTSLVADIRAAGARAHLAAEDAEVAAFRLPAVADIARPVVELLPVEMITLAVAALDGREAGTFRIAGKVTSTE